MMENLSPESKLWIYQCNRFLTDAEIEAIKTELDAFCVQWTAHNKALKAGSLILHKKFIVLAVDETQTDASGCSIDKSVNFLKTLATAYGIDLFSRLNMAYMQDNALKTVHYADIREALENEEINAETLFFNTNIDRLKQIDNAFLLPLKQHWLNKQLQLAI